MQFEPLMKMKKALRASAIAIAVLVLFVMLFSVSFIAVESYHDCHGEDCPVCDLIKLCEGNIKNIGHGLAAAVTASIIVYFVSESVKASGSVLIFSNPVSERVRLNN